MSVEVMNMRIKLYNQGKFWEALVAVSKYVADKAPRVVHGWSNWAYALRMQDRYSEAKEVALKALKLHPDDAALCFNLGCYCSLLGEIREASEHVKKAIALDKRYQEESVGDTDLDDP